MSRKYRHRGYQDGNGEERERSAPPRRELTTEERIQKKSMRHAIDREANEVVRCPNCGRSVDASAAIAKDAACPNCSAALHCCRTCKHFDSAARYQCRAPITTAIGDKINANQCSHHAPRLVLDVTGRRSQRGSGGGASSNDPRQQFENLFKR